MRCALPSATDKFKSRQRWIILKMWLLLYRIPGAAFPPKSCRTSLSDFTKRVIHAERDGGLLSPKVWFKRIAGIFLHKAKLARAREFGLRCQLRPCQTFEVLETSK